MTGAILILIYLFGALYIDENHGQLEGQMRARAEARLHAAMLLFWPLFGVLTLIFALIQLVTGRRR